MKTDNPVLQATLAGILAAGTSMAAGNAWALPDQPKNWEKCAGIAKAGSRCDCRAAGGHRTVAARFGR